MRSPVWVGIECGQSLRRRRRRSWARPWWRQFAGGDVFGIAFGPIIVAVRRG